MPTNLFLAPAASIPACSACDPLRLPQFRLPQSSRQQPFRAAHYLSPCPQSTPIAHRKSPRQRPLARESERSRWPRLVSTASLSHCVSPSFVVLASLIGFQLIGRTNQNGLKNIPGATLYVTLVHSPFWSGIVIPPASEVCTVVSSHV